MSVSTLYTGAILGKLRRMARSSNFNAFKRALQRSLFLTKYPERRRALEDYEASKRAIQLNAVMNGEVSLHERRAFLKSSLALGVATLPLTALIANCATAPGSSAEAIDVGGEANSSHDPVVVLGGGLAGLTAAYRLTRAGVKCEVYEAQNRTGGRVFTKDRFNSESMFCELGGELIDSTHDDILALSRELGLKHDDFRPYDSRVKHHQYYFGGQRYFDEDLTAACEPIAHRLQRDMEKVFKNFEDPVVTYQTHTEAALLFDRISLEEYLDDMPDVDKWVRDSINIAYLTEFGLDTGEQSCINLMMLIDPEIDHGFGIFGESDEAIRIRGGNSRLVEALTGVVQTKAALHLGHRLAKIEDQGARIALTFDQGSSSRTITASRVICTVPFTILRDVDGVQTLGLSPVKRQCISALGYGQNTKHMLGFKARHWRERRGTVPGSSGYTFTDLPSQTLWDSSRAQSGNSGIITTFLGGSAAVDPARGSVDAILADLDAIYPGAKENFDGNHALFRWPSHPFSKGSYACPRVGQYTTLVGSAKEPELGGKLRFAGEHVSEKYQGYMNGAVQTGNIAAKAIIADLRGQPVAQPQPAAEMVT